MHRGKGWCLKLQCYKGVAEVISTKWRNPEGSVTSVRCVSTSQRRPSLHFSCWLFGYMVLILVVVLSWRI